MDTEFKVGDVVVCVDAAGCSNTLSRGRHYELTEVSGDYVRVDNDYGNNFSYWKDRFRLVFKAEPKAAPATDVAQQHHYKRFEIEPLVFITANKLPFWAGNVVKYTCRHDAKDGIKDLKKARDYLDKEIRRMEGEENWCR